MRANRDSGIARWRKWSVSKKWGMHRWLGEKYDISCFALKPSKPLKKTEVSLDLVRYSVSDSGFYLLLIVVIVFMKMIQFNCRTSVQV